MATVTRLKAAVNNKNLPILGNDGNLYNYYFGMFSAKMEDLGYVITSSEKNVLNTFIESGINDGWIDKIAYLMPFIGNRSIPKAGIIPLIDNLGDYDIMDGSVNESLFTYDTSDKIKCFGRGTNQSIPLPANNENFNCLSVFINSNVLADEELFNGSNILTARDDSTVCWFFRKGGVDDERYEFTIKQTAESENEPSYIIGTTVSEEYTPYQQNVFYARYLKDDEVRYKRFVHKRNVADPSYGSGVSSSQLPYTFGTTNLGGNVTRNPNASVNVLALIFPENITESDLRNFDQAVFALTTALGR